MDAIEAAVQQANNQDDMEDATTEEAVETPAKKKPAAKSKTATAKKVPSKVVAKAPEKAKAPAKKAAPKVAKVPAEVRNDIARPQKGTTSGKVWDFADAANKTKAGAVRKTILDKAAAVGINAATAATQFARWRQFNGITGAAK